MAAAAAPVADAGAAAPAPAKGKKKLIIIAGAALLVLAIAGAGTALFLKKRAAAAAAGEDTSAQADAHHSAKPDLKHPPTFLPLDPFVVNLADKEVDRYAQVGITFEVEDAKFAEQMKAFMPAIRNGILMILAHKSSTELLERAGKERLAGEILAEAARTMGIDVEPAAEPAEAKAKAEDAKPGEDDDPKPVKKAAKAAPSEPNPIRRVHFSNFIVQ
ncbi:MAG TPA: flagellar basal body-associated FliL family protein [Burkholderiaceae bacterium]|nr:flagellar basal body-associated FliL family protein [Burkholderiaceae bacterium]